MSFVSQIDKTAVLTAFGATRFIILANRPCFIVRSVLIGPTNNQSKMCVPKVHMNFEQVKTEKAPGASRHIEKRESQPELKIYAQVPPDA